MRLLTVTLRVRHVHPEHVEDTPQYILSFWHAQMLPIIGRSRWHKPIAVIVSRSKDGDFSASVLRRFGVEAARGSSSRGGALALREFIRQARNGRNLGFTPDGPRGPARVAKEGVVYAAQASGLPIVPLAFAASSSWHLKSWDRMVIPRPFSRGVFIYGEPMMVPRDSDAAEWRLKVEQTMNALCEEAERMVKP